MTNRSDLPIASRALIAAGYLIVLVALLAYFEGDLSFVVNSGPRNLLFVATAVTLVLGNYILEPFYSKPADVFVNTVGLFLAVVAFSPATASAGRLILLVFLATLAVAAFVLIASSYRWVGRSREVTFTVVTRIGRSKLIYGAAYALIVISYFDSSKPEFWALLAYLLAVMTIRPLEALASSIARVLRSRDYPVPIGRVTRRVGDSTLQFAISPTADSSTPSGRLVEISVQGGLRYLAGVVSTQNTVDGTLRTARLIKHGGEYQARRAAAGELISIGDPPRGMGVVFNFDALIPAAAEGEAATDLSARIDGLQRIVGVVASGSSSELVLVDLFEELEQPNPWSEGAVLECDLQGERCLLQIVAVEALESREIDNSRDTFWRASCTKLGALEEGTGKFNPVAWVPVVGEVVRAAISALPPTSAPGEVSLVVGTVPGLNEQVRLRNSERLVTHNSAVLGALGTGKTTLAVRLLSDVVTSTDVRVVSIDVTREHRGLFESRLGAGLVCELDPIIEAGLSAQADFVMTHNRGSRDPVQDTEGSGNVDLFRVNVRAAICDFLFDAIGPTSSTAPAISGTRRVLVVNPENFHVTRGEKMGFQVNCVALSTAEKCRIISEELLSVSMELGLAIGGAARISLVLEEAHSLVPEYNFIAQDGDKAATNGTARVVLQGRKYGLGAMVIAQRTANVTKSILSQCSTIFALRIFDDTGRDFLSNFIGERQAATLSQLPNHHAVVVGEGIASEQALMVKLPTPS